MKVFNLYLEVMVEMWLLGYTQNVNKDLPYVKEMFLLAMKHYTEGWILDYWRGAADAVLSAYGF